MYTLSKKQIASISRGEKLKIALPPPFKLIEALDNAEVDRDRLHKWAIGSFADIHPGTITRVTIEDIWLDCTSPLGGLCEYFGAIIPDVSKFSSLSLPPIPTTVVVVEISPPNPVAEAAKIQWPYSWMNASGHTFVADDER